MQGITYQTKEMIDMARHAKCYKTKKDCFPTKFECDLDRARIQINEKGHRKMAFREIPVRSYQCEFCGQWHHTSQAKDEENESRTLEW